MIKSLTSIIFLAIINARSISEMHYKHSSGKEKKSLKYCKTISKNTRGALFLAEEYIFFWDFCRYLLEVFRDLVLCPSQDFCHSSFRDFLWGSSYDIFSISLGISTKVSPSTCAGVSPQETQDLVFLT